MESPLFIIGPPRSGTTLVGAILNQHPKMNITLETNYFDAVFPYVKGGNISDVEELSRRLIESHRKSLSPEQRGELPKKLLSSDWLQSKLNYPPHSPVKPLIDYLKAHAELKEAKYFGEKTPRHLFHLDTIRSNFPESPIIFCIRNGLDFMASYKTKHKPNNESGNPPLYHPIITSYYWNKMTKNILGFRKESSKNNQIMIHYEELVQDSQRQIKKICNFLKINFQEDMLQPEANNSSYKANFSDSIDDRSVGKWKKILSATETEIFLGYNAKNLKKFDYKIPSINGNLLAKTKFLLYIPLYGLRLTSFLLKNKNNLTHYLSERLFK